MSSSSFPVRKFCQTLVRHPLLQFLVLLPSGKVHVSDRLCGTDKLPSPAHGPSKDEFLALLLTAVCVSLGKLLHLSEPWVFHL
jgi:hypothetical protein